MNNNLKCSDENKVPSHSTLQPKADQKRQPERHQQNIFYDLGEITVIPLSLRLRTLPWYRMSQVVPTFVKKFINTIGVVEMTILPGNVQSKRVRMLMAWDVFWVIEIQLNVNEVPSKINDFPGEVKESLVLFLGCSAIVGNDV